MKFIKLTTVSDRIVYVNPKKIVSIRMMKESTLITYPGDDDNCDSVKETPEEIINRISLLI